MVRRSGWSSVRYGAARTYASDMHVHPLNTHSILQQTKSRYRVALIRRSAHMQCTQTLRSPIRLAYRPTNFGESRTANNTCTSGALQLKYYALLSACGTKNVLCIVYSRTYGTAVRKTTRASSQQRIPRSSNKNLDPATMHSIFISC